MIAKIEKLMENSKYMQQALFTLLFCCFFALPALAWEAEVLRISDGDTITVRPVTPELMPDFESWDGKDVHIRLYGVDTPEGPGSRWQGQPWSRAATKFVKSLVPPGSRVSILDQGYDKYTRTVGGVIRLSDGKIIQEELLRAGLAWVYPKYCRSCEQWTALQERAKRERKGLWRDMGSARPPIPPWEWRRGAPKN